MELSDLLGQTSEWLKGTGDSSDIVVSSRIRLARNLEKIPFSHWANEKQKKQILDIIKPVVINHELMKEHLFCIIDELDEVDKNLLLERHLVSKEHIQPGGSKAVVIKNNETLSIMINEEDHLRMQAIKSGFNLQGAWDIVKVIDEDLSGKLEYAFSNNWGYLTACPTNTGTGMRASVMLHLPSLVMTNQINKVLQAIAKLSLAVRGFYGEGSDATGNFFQVSNQITLGYSEDEIIDSLSRVIKQIISQEKQSRINQLNNQRKMLEDKIWRAYGVLSNAKVISSSETIDLLSNLRLGSDLDIVNGINSRFINELFIIIQPAHIQKVAGKKLNSAQRDEKRAEIIKDKLKK